MVSSMASCLALSMKPQVLIITASARAGSWDSSKPASRRVYNIISASTWFLGHPRDTIPILVGMLVPLLFLVLLIQFCQDRIHSPAGVVIAVAQPHQSGDDLFPALFIGFQFPGVFPAAQF